MHIWALKWVEVVVLSTLLLGVWTSASAGERGLEIAIRADQSDTGWGDNSAHIEMILKNRQNKTSMRKLRSSNLEVADDGDKLLVLFDMPADVRGTAFLTHTHRKGADDQWLFLPALKRVKRISSNNKSGPFMGSEFAYEDLTSQEVEKYTYRFLREETVDGRAQFVVERIAVESSSGYQRQEVYYDHEFYYIRRIVSYDRKGELLKTLDYLDMQQYLNRYWRAGRLSMVNHQNGKSTELHFSEYEFGKGLDGRDFDHSTLTRQR